MYRVPFFLKVCIVPGHYYNVVRLPTVRLVFNVTLLTDSQYETEMRFMGLLLLLIATIVTDMSSRVLITTDYV